MNPKPIFDEVEQMLKKLFSSHLASQRLTFETALQTKADELGQAAQPALRELGRLLKDFLQSRPRLPVALLPGQSQQLELLSQEKGRWLALVTLLEQMQQRKALEPLVQRWFEAKVEQGQRRTQERGVGLRGTAGGAGSLSEQVYAQVGVPPRATAPSPLEMPEESYGLIDAMFDFQSAEPDSAPEEAESTELPAWRTRLGCGLVTQMDETLLLPEIAAFDLSLEGPDSVQAQIGFKTDPNGVYPGVFQDQTVQFQTFVPLLETYAEQQGRMACTLTLKLKLGEREDHLVLAGSVLDDLEPLEVLAVEPQTERIVVRFARQPQAFERLRATLEGGGSLSVGQVLLTYERVKLRMARAGSIS